MNQNEFDEKYGFETAQKRTLCDTLGSAASANLRPLSTIQGLKKLVQRRVPVLRWLRRYKWTGLGHDFIAGCTLGIYNVPQGMAYSVLASLPPVYGLYASFFPPLLYAIFGSSRHVSIGVFSITCLMVAHTRLAIIPDGLDGKPNATSYQGIENLTPISVVVSLSFATGIIQLTMALLHLDFLTAYLSTPLIAGFNTGAVFHALINIIPSLLGLKIGKVDSQLFMFFKQLYRIGEALGTTNIAVGAISLISIIYLLFCKFVLEKKLRLKIIPFPTELILMISVTVASYFWDFQNRFALKIVGEVPTGMPSPMMPRFELIPHLLGDAFSIAIVAFAVTVSLGKHFARVHKYVVDPNQELCALGAAGCISSFFQVFPCSTSFSRSIVNEAGGARSQLSGMVSASIVALVILWIGPLLSSLPMCVLSAIVVVALRQLLVKVKDAPKLYRVSKIDFSVWLVTFVATICWDLIQGLLAGIVFAILTVVLRTQWPRIHFMALLENGEYCENKLYKLSKQPAFPVLSFDAPLIFTNIERFRDAVRAAAQRALAMNNNITFPLSSTESDAKVHDIEAAGKLTWSVVIVDASMWTYTDAMGIEAIRELVDELKDMSLKLFLVGVHGSVREQFDSAELFKELPPEMFYPNIAEATKAADVVHLQRTISPLDCSSSSTDDSKQFLVEKK